MKKFVEWIKAYFNKQYELTIWFVREETDTGAFKTKTRVERKFIIKKYKIYSQNHITGIDINGRKFEIKTTEPVDYYLRGLP